jgi:exosortase D (VPLPA-CTERM-specific)
MTVQYFKGPRRQGEGAQTAALLSNGRIAFALVVASLALACLTAQDGLINLYDRWRHEDEYGYGFLAAAIVPVLLWRRWDLIQALSTERRWPGLALIVVAQLFGVLGSLGESYFIEQLAFVFTLLGLAIVTFGTGPLRIFAPLALILLLTIPLPYTLQAIITVKLQLISTEIGVAAIRLMGIPVFVEGNVIDLGQYKLQVAEACSGLRYLLPLTCISVILAVLYEAPLWKRAIIVASAPPITVLINSFRIAVVAALVNSFGSHMAEGFLHDFEGWVVFLVGALLLLVEILALERFRFANITIESILDRPSGLQAAAKPIVLTSSALVSLLVCVAAVGVVTWISWADQFALKPSRATFVTFPQQVEGWSGREDLLEPAILKVLQPTDYYNGSFSKTPNGVPVNLFIPYYDSLSKGAAIHSPRVCLPGTGWEFALFQEKNFGDLEPNTGGSFNRVIVQKGEQKILMYYWFQQRQRRTASEFTMKYYLLVDSLTKSRKDGALIRIYTPIASGGTAGVAEADARLQRFAQDFLPTINKYIPQ